MRYRRYALERIGATVGVFLLAVVGTFVICHVIGPISLKGGTIEPAVRARAAAYANESFFDFLSRLFSGDLAQSIYTGAQGFGLGAAPSVPDASLVTLSVVAWTIFIGLLISVTLGLLWDWKPRWTRFVAWPFVYLAASMLTIWVAIELSRYLIEEWGLFPFGTYTNFFDGPIDWAYHLILPAFVLCLPFAAIYTRVVRAAARNVRRARADATEDEREATVARVRRAGLLTISKGLLRDIGWLMGAALFVEVGFGLPGLGRAMELAVFNADTPLIENVLIFGTLVAVGIHLCGTLIGGAVSKQWRLGA